MHNYIFDAATNGLLLQAEEINPVACKEPRPVYAEEMICSASGVSLTIRATPACR